MLNEQFGGIKTSSINEQGVELKKSILAIFMYGIILVIVTIIVISLDIFLVTHNILSAEVFNKSFPGICAIFLIMLGKHFLFDLSKLPYKIRFNIADKQIEIYNIASNIINVKKFDENEIQVTSNNKHHVIHFFNTNNILSLNLTLSSNNITSKDIISFITKNFKAKETQIDTTITYDCIHCGYKQFADFEYCPKCGKNDDGNTKKN